MTHTKPCEITGCKRPVRACGYCEMHYRRWRKHGDPTHVAKTGRKKGQPKRKPAPASRLIVQCGDCRELLAIVTTRQSIWAAIDNHQCRRTA